MVATSADAEEESERALVTKMVAESDEEEESTAVEDEEKERLSAPFEASDPLAVRLNDLPSEELDASAKDSENELPPPALWNRSNKPMAYSYSTVNAMRKLMLPTDATVPCFIRMPCPSLSASFWPKVSAGRRFWY